MTPATVPPEPELVHGLVLLSRFTVQISARIAQVVGESGVPTASFRLFNLVCECPGQLPSALADELDIDRTVVSRRLRELDRSGLISRQFDATDRRRVRVHPTSEGLARMTTMSAGMAQFFTDAATLTAQIITAAGGMPAADPDESDLTPMQVMERIGRLGSDLVAEFISVEQGYGVTHYLERFVLWKVCNNPGRGPSDLAALLDQSRSNISNILDRLEALGLITRSRRRAGRDERRVQLTLTARGHALVAAETQIFAARRKQIVDAFELARRPFIASTVA